MIWQDVAILVIQVGFIFALFPSLFGTQKPNRWTCLLTGSLLLALAAVLATLGTIGGPILMASTGLLWFWLAIR